MRGTGKLAKRQSEELYRALLPNDGYELSVLDSNRYRIGAGDACHYFVESYFEEFASEAAGQPGTI